MTRAAILARGLGTRMRLEDGDAALTPDQQRAADAGLKTMMPINGHAFLAYALSALADAQLTEIALVVAPDHSVLRHYFERHPPQRVRVSFQVQQEPLGTADAVLALESWAGGDPFLVMNGDNLYPVAALRALAAAAGPALPAFTAGDLIATGNIPSERIAAFATVEFDERGYLRTIREKPSPEGNVAEQADPFVSMNCWKFDRGIFPACRDVPPSPRGEYELPEAVGLAVSRGMRIKGVPARGPVLDLSRRADAADVGRRLAGITPWP